jgi:hypothetical protein
MRIPVLSLGWTLRFEFDTGVGDVALKSAHAIDQHLRERDRVVDGLLVDPGKPSILKTAGVHDGLGAVISVWQSCKYLL